MRTTQPSASLPIGTDVITQNLVDYWGLNEGGGKITLGKGTDKYGALTGNAIFKIAQKGQCINFDGTNSFVDVVSLQRYNTIMNAGNSVSVVATVYPTTIGTTQKCVVSKMHTVNNQPLFLLQLSTTGFVQWQITSGAAASVYTTTTSGLSVNNWYTIAATHTFGDATSTKVYVNGILCTGAWAGSGAVSVTSVNTNPLYIGHLQHASFPGWFIGNIKDVILCNVTLPQIVIQQLYKQPYGIFR